MKTAGIVALSSFLSLVAAAPLNKDKRDIVWVTDYAEVTETVALTTTVWVDAPRRAQATGNYNGQPWGYYRSRGSAAATTAADATSAAPAASSSVSAAETESSASNSVVAAPTSSNVAPASSNVAVASSNVAPASSNVAPASSNVAPASSNVAPASTQAPSTIRITSTIQVPATVVISSTAGAPATTQAPAPAPATTGIPAPAPATTQTSATTQAPAAPSSVYVAPAPTTSAAAPAVSAASSASGTVYTGDITHYDVGLGSCGWTNTANEAVVAIPHGMMNNPANPNLNPLCGKTITISYQGAQHQAKIVDTCGGCDNAAIDLSNSLFAAVAPNGDGRVHGINWWYN